MAVISDSVDGKKGLAAKILNWAGAGNFCGFLLDIDGQVGRVRGLLRGSSIAMAENDNGSCTVNWRNVLSSQLEL